MECLTIHRCIWAIFCIRHELIGFVFVTGNADDISTNNDNISDNAGDIATLIAEAIINADDISSNADSITSNTDDTEDNEGAIANNTATLEPLKLVNITGIQVKHMFSL